MKITAILSLSIICLLIGHSTTISANIVQRRYQILTNSCAELASSTATRGLNKRISLGVITIEIDHPNGEISGGSAGFGAIRFIGKPNKFVACHEVFHLLWENLSLNFVPPMPMFPATASGKTTELYESLPQIFSILANGKCQFTQTAQVVAAFSFDHCQYFYRNELPSAKTRYAMAKEYLASQGIENAIINYLYSTASPTEPSAYDASRPLGAILFNALEDCGRDFLLSELISFLYTSARNNDQEKGIFDNTDKFGKYFILSMIDPHKKSKQECREDLIKGLKYLGPFL